MGRYRGFLGTLTNIILCSGVIYLRINSVIITGGTHSLGQMEKNTITRPVPITLVVRGFGVGGDSDILRSGWSRLLERTSQHEEGEARVRVILEGGMLYRNLFRNTFMDFCQLNPFSIVRIKTYQYLRFVWSFFEPFNFLIPIL